MKLTVGVRRLPPPGTVEEEAACCIVRDYNDLAAKLRDGARKMAFKEGDHVQLKSGGAEMIVTKIEAFGELTVVNCVWFDENHHLQRAPFPTDVLELALK